VLLRTHLRRPVPAAALAVGLLLVACGDADDQAAPAPATEETTDAEEDEAEEQPSTETTDDDAEASEAPEASEASEAGGGSTEGPFNVRTGSIDLQETVEFDSGVQVAVTGITVEPMAIFVDVQVLNGWSDDFTLAGFNEPRLTDNADRQYPYVTPEENQDLLVPAGGSLEATLAFRGAVNPNATRVELVMNRNSSQDRRQEALFRDLPLPEGS
jgi:hypothetical protein